MGEGTIEREVFVYIMARSLVLWLLWLGFILYLLFFAPPIQPDTFAPLQELLSGRVPFINPVILSLFSLVGIWLLIYSCLIFADGRMQSIRAWVFMVASLATGTLGLIPYLAARRSERSFSGKKDLWLSILDSRITGAILSFSAVVLVLFALLRGDWPGFAREFATNRFINGMSIAFILFCLLFPFPTLLGDDAARRGVRKDSIIFQIAVWLPLFGPLVYLCFRPALPAGRSAESEKTPELADIR
jgi:hypothetical protein